MIRPLLLLLFCTPALLLAQNFTLIKNVDVWDGRSDQLRLEMEVLIENNLIAEVAKEISIPEGAHIIDGGGGTLIPGLSDAHVHLTMTMGSKETRNEAHWMYTSIRAAKAAENFLRLGFTTVRDLGGPVFGLKRAIDEGLVPGPRIYPSGAFITQTSGHGDMRNPNDIHPHWSGNIHAMDIQGWSYMVDGVPEVLKASRENLKNGATQLKVMAGGGISSDFDPLHSIQFRPEELEAAVQAAADWDTYVAVHIYTPQGITRALHAGVKCIDHGHLIDEAAMKLLKEKDAWLVPQSYWSQLPDMKGLSESQLVKMRAVKAGAVNEMILAKKYQVNLAYGTDAYGQLGAEAMALKEFTSRSRWFSPVEILRQATSENARLFALSGKTNPYTTGSLGLIEKGAYADLLIYKDNPLKDIEVIVNYKEQLQFIMKDGEVFWSGL